MKEQPLVSIIMPNKNGKEFLKETINSLLNQTYSNWELLFFDSLSTDGSLDIVESMSDDRFNIFSKEIGVSAARFEGISRSRGSFIAFLDSDDIWASNKLEIQISEISSNDKMKHLV